ncbi:MAG: serine/threonine protein kinase [Myxococcales bacterium]|nr:serine/threonine protein kinase [Myxococcales bacterium]
MFRIALLNKKAVSGSPLGDQLLHYLREHRVFPDVQLMVETFSSPQAFQDAWVRGEEFAILLCVDSVSQRESYLAFYTWLTGLFDELSVGILSGAAKEEIASTLGEHASLRIFEHPIASQAFLAWLHERYLSWMERNGRSEPAAKVTEKEVLSLEGRQIGSILVEHVIAHGGMSVVYKGSHPFLGRDVALKVILPQYARDERFIRRLRQEALSISRIKHPNIIQVFDAGYTEGEELFYIAMEFIEGEDVCTRLKREGRFDEEMAVDILLQAARGLHAAHQAGLVHRDLKPSNLLLSQNGVVTLTDFGIVKTTEGANLTQEGMIVGTPDYLSPEQAAGIDVDARSDIYSLGLTFYEMLVGDVAFPEPTLLARVTKRLRVPPPSMLDKLPYLSEKVVRIFRRMTHLHPEDRYANAEELIWDVEEAQQILSRIPRRGRPTSDQVPMMVPVSPDQFLPHFQEEDLSSTAPGVHVASSGLHAVPPPPNKAETAKQTVEFRLAMALDKALSDEFAMFLGGNSSNEVLHSMAAGSGASSPFLGASSQVSSPFFASATPPPTPIQGRSHESYPLLELAGQSSHKSKPPQKVAFEQILFEAKQAYLKQDLERALMLFEECLQMEPEHPLARQNAEKLRQRLGKVS